MDIQSNKLSDYDINVEMQESEHYYLPVTTVTRISDGLIVDTYVRQWYKEYWTRSMAETDGINLAERCILGYV
jgi:hypothetical protein